MLKTLLVAILAISMASAAHQDQWLGGRIVGGANATEGQFPHQVSLREFTSHICGGSIIAPQIILTAAHCVSTKASDGTIKVTSAKMLSIRAGSVDRLNGGVTVKVSKVIVHEKYVYEFPNDVAVLLLQKPLVYSSVIRAIPLTSSDTPVGSKVVISGWGLLSSKDSSLPRELQWTTLNALSKESCINSTTLNTSSIICLAHEEGTGACNGDSGGPAIHNGELVGIAGFVTGGIGCGSSNPDGYAKVFHHRNWIVRNANMLTNVCLY